MKEKRKLFTDNWSYKEGFIISFTLVIIALVMEFTTGGTGFSIPAWPYNLAGLISFTLLIGLLHLFEKSSSVIRFLGSVPAAISSISLVTILAVLLGSIPQTEVNSEFLNKTGLGHLTSSYLYFYGYLYFLITLGLSTVKRLFPFKLKNIGYLLNHLGLYIIIVAAIASSGDIERLYFVLYDENKEFTNIALDDDNKQFELPISVKLNKFNIEEYKPKLVVVGMKSGDIENMESKMLYEIDTLKPADFEKWEIHISKYYKYAQYDLNDSTFKASMKAGSIPVAFVKAINKKTKDTIQDWLTCGNYTYQRKNINLDNDSYLAMLAPEAKTFMSEIEVKDSNGELHKLTLKVNEPAIVDGWYLYQTGYNEKLGKWSNYSIIEAGRDDWLGFVYLGVFMLIAGAIYILWIGNTLKSEE